MAGFSAGKYIDKGNTDLSPCPPALSAARSYPHHSAIQTGFGGAIFAGTETILGCASDRTRPHQQPVSQLTGLRAPPLASGKGEVGGWRG